MKGASFSRLMIRLPCRGGDRGINVSVSGVSYASGLVVFFLVFSPANMLFSLLLFLPMLK